MPELDEIINDLSNRLSRKVANIDKLNHWLNKLLEDIFGQVLCVNLYIDLRSGYLNEEQIGIIIDEIDFPSTGARAAFYEYVEKYQSKVLFSNLEGPQTIENDQYVRILPIRDMIDYYLRSALKLPLTYEAQREVMERFFELPDEDREELGIVTEVWRGRMMNVWVTSKSELELELSRLPTSDAANVIRDRLGFYEPNEGIIVYVIYPEKFDKPMVYKPTTIDAHYGCFQYLSIITKKGWGRSCCLNSLSDGLDERVHEAIKGLTNEFKMKILGVIDQKASPDLEHLLNEALRRAV
jgi:hypothetical protein